nr:GMC oxidoreductase [Hyphomonas sp. Mor2]
MNLVIGSGPAGVSAAMALIARGQSVTLLDGGKTLPENLRDRQNTFADKAADTWSDEDALNWQQPQLEHSGDLAMRFGSTHAQTPLDDLFAPETPFSGRSSHASGGLSNVWGAAVLPYRQQDIAAWPVTADELASHYQAVSRFMPISGTSGGDLQDLFTAFDAAALTALPSGPQASALLDRLADRREALRAAGVFFGPSRQAVRDSCFLCGQCLHGCPWSLIYSAEQTLTELRRSERFTYRPGAIVTGLSKSGEACRIHLSDGEVLSADKVFLATGVYETARLVLGTMSDSESHLTLQDSRQFFLPMLHRWRATSDPSKRPLHTLAKAFVEIDNADVSPYLTHSQIYSWNEYYAREMSANYGRGIPGSGALFRMISKRLLVAQTFLHSDHCDQVELRLDQKTNRLKTSILPNADMLRTIDRAAATLGKALSQAGLQPLTFAKRVEAPGASFHSGGTLPMSASPDRLQTDPLGRLSGFENLHIVDASVLPSIPASTITFTVMANAHRIGSLA